MRSSATAPDAQELQPILDRLSVLSDLIARNAQPARAWRNYLEQGELLLHLALRSQGEERDKLLKMAVDSHYGAAVQCPENDPTGYQHLVQLPGQLTRLCPGNPVIAYAARQEVQADYMRMFEKAGADTDKVQGHLCRRLMAFAQDYVGTPEGPKAVQEAGRIYESMGQTEEAKHCYRFLIEHCPADVLARKAHGALWRLGRDGEPIHLQLPLLYSGDDSGGVVFNSQELLGKAVIVYFWSSTTAQTAQDFQLVKQLTDRFQNHGLEAVYVNLDSDPAAARTFLSSQLTAGVHLYQRGGLESTIAEQYGIQTLPQVMVVGRDGTLIRHSLQAAQLEAIVTGLISAGH